MKEPYTRQIEVNKESVNVLVECIELQLKKAQDYQNPNSRVVQADYYPRGVETLYDQVLGKLFRVRSLLDAAKEGQDGANFESIEDSIKDLINYASFMAAYVRGGIEGQDYGHDMFNEPFKRERTGPRINLDQGSECCGGKRHDES